MNREQAPQTTPPPEQKKTSTAATGSRPPRHGKKRGSKRRRFLLVLMLLVVGFIAYALMPATRWIAATGYLMTDDEVELRSSVEAPIQRWLASSGDQVQAGQVVMQLDDSLQQAALQQTRSELAAMKARLQRLSSRQALQRAQLLKQIEQAQSQYELAKSQLERMTDGGLGYAPKEIEDAQMRVHIARARLEELRIDRDQLMEDEIKVLHEEIAATENQLLRREQELSSRKIRSPIDGRISFNSYEPGEVVKLEDVLGQVFDESQWIVKITISERDRRHVREGQSVLVTLRGYPTYHYDYVRAKVSRIFPVITPRATGDGVFYAEAMIENFGRIDPTPGMTAQSWIDTGEMPRLFIWLGW